MSTSRPSTRAALRRLWLAGASMISRVVDELASKGVDFERYDEGPIMTNEKGIATFERDAKVAYFKDPDGNTLSIAQAPRS